MKKEFNTAEFKDVKKIRNSSIELLRIIAMLFIVMSHSSVHGHFQEQQFMPLYNRILLNWLSLGSIGVDIFILITGYFLCQKERTFKSAMSLHAQVLFYSVTLFVISNMFSCNISIKSIFMAFFPTLFNTYWFFTGYIILLIFSPYINIFISNITKEQFFKCLLIMMVLWVIIPTFTNCKMYGDVIPQFFMLYMIGSYIRIYPENILTNKKIAKSICLISFFLLYLSSIILNLLCDYYPKLLIQAANLYDRTSLLAVGCAIGLFCVSLNVNNFYSKFINKIAGFTFGVYLIHDNPFIRNLLWNTFFRNNLYSDSPMLVLHLVVSVIIVYISCILIDIVYKYFIEEKLLFFYSHVAVFFDKIFNSVK